MKAPSRITPTGEGIFYVSPKGYEVPRGRQILYAGYGPCNNPFTENKVPCFDDVRPTPLFPS